LVLPTTIGFPFGTFQVNCCRLRMGLNIVFDEVTASFFESYTSVDTPRFFTSFGPVDRLPPISLVNTLFSHSPLGVPFGQPFSLLVFFFLTRCYCSPTLPFLFPLDLVCLAASLSFLGWVTVSTLALKAPSLFTLLGPSRVPPAPPFSKTFKAPFGFPQTRVPTRTQHRPTIFLTSSFL